MVVDSILLNAESGPNDHRKDAPLFTIFSVGLLHNYIRPEEPGNGMFDDIKVRIWLYFFLIDQFLAVLATMGYNRNFGSSMAPGNIFTTRTQLSHWLFWCWWFIWQVCILLTVLTVIYLCHFQFKTLELRRWCSWICWSSNFRIQSCLSW